MNFMAKINIHLNNKVHSVDESALLPAYDKLHTHLSAVMSGDGATVKLDGTEYSVDATKLSVATDELVAWLTKIAGTGYKVVVNGVEYRVDSGKLQTAMSDFESVLNSFGGSGTVCSTCNGNGKVCGMCGGTIESNELDNACASCYPAWPEPMQACPECAGTGKPLPDGACHTCAGSGMLCDWCGGPTKNGACVSNCPMSENMGCNPMQCSNCGGTGKAENSDT
jgi:hypothetical protein